MTDALQLTELPQAAEMIMIAGWRQWADAGSISSGLPHYLKRQLKARKIGALQPDGFYLFQIPGTHDLVRPVVRLEDGFPKSLETRRNEFFYAQVGDKGVVLFSGDEPHLDVERYAEAFFAAVAQLGVRRVVGLGGVYGELPYDRERIVSAIYSRPPIKDELDNYAVNLSNYQGGSSIGTYLCHYATEHAREFVGFYSFVPTYDFSQLASEMQGVRIENDFMAWYGVMRRINHMFALDIDLSDLEQQSDRLVSVMDEKVNDLERNAPELGIRAYMERLSSDFEEAVFLPLDAVWEEELNALFDDLGDASGDADL